MKILWVNPSFLDYRVPFYAEMNRLCNGNFFLAYSKERVPERCVKKIEEVLGENAHGLECEKRFAFGNTKADFSCKGISIPFPSGLSALLAKIPADAVVAEGFFQWTPWAIAHARRLGVPLFIAYERTQHTERNCPWWRLLYRKMVNRYVAGYLVNGSLCRRYLEQTMRVKGKSITEGIMAADSSGMSTWSLVRESRNVADGLRYIYVGRLIKLKGVAYLIDAWKQHYVQYPNDELIIVGDGPEMSNLMELSEGNVSFVGAVEYDSIYKYYAAADVFIIPTLEDNWSLVVPEAMACGLPIACSIYNGCYPEMIIEGKNGYTFDPLNKKDICRVLSEFHNSDLTQMGSASRKIEKEYTPQKAAMRCYSAMKLACYEKTPL